MRPSVTSRRRGRSVLTLLLLVLLAAACTPAPPPASPAAGAAGAFSVPPGTYAFRDPRHGAPPPPLSGGDAKTVELVLEGLRRGDAPSAARSLVRRRRKGETPAPLKLAAAYVALAEGRNDDGRRLLSALATAWPGWVAAVEAEADLAAAEKRPAEALERYRAVLRLVPGDRRAAARVEAFRAEVADEKRREAEEALRSGDLDAARRAAHALLQLEPGSAAGLVLLSRAAAAGGKAEDAWTWAKEARKKAPLDRTVAAFAAEAAAKTGRWADAAALYQGLAESDPAFAPKADEARLEFRVQNLPSDARAAAQSQRLTRAQLAALLWWTVPEYREALVPPGAEIAVDVVDRADRSTLVRAIGLGFFVVSPETHRVGADAPVGRSELAAALRRVAVLAGRGREPRGCLTPDPPSPASLAECGILEETSTRSTTGREAMRALEKAARLGREGGAR